MGLTKDNNYSTNQLNVALFGKAIGHPARAKILELLQTRKDIPFEQLHKLLNLSQPTTRIHVEKLKCANLIKEYYIFHSSFIQIDDSFQDEFDEILKIIEHKVSS